MKKQNSLFIIFCLSLSLAFMSVYNLFVSYFNGHKAYELRLSSMKEQIERERFKNTLLAYQIKDFQQSVAQMLPEGKSLKTNYALQSFASVLRTPASEGQIDLSSVIFERGMAYYNSRSYDKATKEFRDLIEKYPLSVYSIRSRFFIAEINYLKKDFDKCLAEVEIMVSQYPFDKLTGFILLRMGQISHLNNQPDVAKEVYRIVIDKFKDEDDLRQQAQNLYEGVK